MLLLLPFCLQASFMANNPMLSEVSARKDVNLFNTFILPTGCYSVKMLKLLNLKLCFRLDVSVGHPKFQVF